jgi:hypothetical protein
MSLFLPNSLSVSQQFSNGSKAIISISDTIIVPFAVVDASGTFRWRVMQDVKTYSVCIRMLYRDVIPLLVLELSGHRT